MIPTGFEARRKQLLKFFASPQLASFDLAQMLVKTQREALFVACEKEQWTFNELLRVKWFEFSLVQSDFKLAAQLAVTPREDARLLHAKLAASSGCLSCADQRRKSLESKRRLMLVDAIDKHDWEVAAVLVSNKEEKDSLDNAQLRVDLMNGFARDGRLDMALELAETIAEREHLLDLQRQLTSNYANLSPIQIASVVTIQKWVRCFGVRFTRVKEKRNAAATILQRAYLRYSSKVACAEMSRLELFEYFLQRGEWDKALKFTRSRMERRRVFDVQRTQQLSPFLGCFGKRAIGSA